MASIESGASDASIRQHTQQAESPQVAIVVLNYNAWSVTLECLRSLRKGSLKNIPVFVVDNGSTDDSVQALKSSLRPEEILIVNRSNTGFTGGMNIGLVQCLRAQAKYALLLNNDTIVEKGVLEELLTYMEAHSEVAVCGPRVNETANPDQPQSARHDGIIGPIDDPLLSGCAFLLRVRTLRVAGFFDDNFFIYWEENDFWQRIMKAGYRVVYLPTRAIVLHGEGGGHSSRTVAKGLYLLLRNEFLFKRRYHGNLRTLFSLLKRQVYEIAAARSYPLFRMKAIFQGIRLWIQDPPPTWDIEGCASQEEIPDLFSNPRLAAQ